eukprot:GHVQ01025372.1.p1 GENE.GHVQ01025372.1~~GHVQ01025372.1.p1  ORF type:complete len:517 (-),score=73.49 GHVQ01025372.1:546-2096(-)
MLRYLPAILPAGTSPDDADAVDSHNDDVPSYQRDLHSIGSAPVDLPPTMPKRWQWARPQVEGNSPCARGGHTATLVKNRIFVFGGHHYDGKETGFRYFNDLFILDVDKNTWLHPSCKGTAPSPRYGHTASLVAHRIVFFGGKGPRKKKLVGMNTQQNHTSSSGRFSNGSNPNGGSPEYMRDLHALDTTNNTWYQGPVSGGAPCGRYGHSCERYKTKLYIFGGASGASTLLDDLHCLDLTSMAWTCPATTGSPPSQRTGHASCLINSNMIVHGGLGRTAAAITMEARRNSRSLNDNDLCVSDWYKEDIRSLDIDTMTWFRVRVHGTPPVGRYGHTVSVSAENIIVFGGWTPVAQPYQMSTAGTVKDKSNLISSQKKENGTTDSMTRQGGVSVGSLGTSCANSPHIDSGKRPSAVVALDTVSKWWRECDSVGVPSGCRYGHSCTSIGPHMVIFGGWDGGKPLGDLVVLRDRMQEQHKKSATATQAAHGNTAGNLCEKETLNNVCCSMQNALDHSFASL